MIVIGASEKTQGLIKTHGIDKITECIGQYMLDAIEEESKERAELKKGMCDLLIKLFPGCEPVEVIQTHANYIKNQTNQTQNIDLIGKYELILIDKTEEINKLDTQIDTIKDIEYMRIENLYDRMKNNKHSEILEFTAEYNDLSNAEKRKIKVKDNLAANKNYTELVQKCSKLKTEALVMRVTAESLKRQHEREIRGLKVKEI